MASFPLPPHPVCHPCKLSTKTMAFSSSLHHFPTPTSPPLRCLPPFQLASISCLPTPTPAPSLHPLLPPLTQAAEDKTSNKGEEPRTKLVWPKLGPELTEAQLLAVSQLPPKMTKRCKALMERLICLAPTGEDLGRLLFLWVRIMKPRRADWLAVLRELGRMASPLFLEVMELALQEDSFEANVRDYTKIIDNYAKQNRLEDAENAFAAMKERGFTYDQVTLTVLIQMYSKAGYLKRAEEIFEELKLLGLPLDKRAYGSMIMAYIRAGMPERGESLMIEMDSRDVYAGREVYKALLRAYSTAGNADGARRVFKAIQLAGIVPDVKLCALLINAYNVAGDSEKARIVLENLQSAGLEPSDKCVALMLAAYEKEKKLDKAMALLTELEMDGVVLGKEAYEVIAKWFHRIGVVHEIEHVLRDYSEC